MPDSPDQLLKQASDVLNKSLVDYDSPQTSAEAHRYNTLTLQAAIFHYDVVYEYAAFWRAKTDGFPQQVALKGFISKLFEYDLQMQQRFLPEMTDLAKARNIEIQGYLRGERRKWTAELRTLQGWAALRNGATSHYGRDIENQVKLLRSIRLESVEQVSHAFTSYHLAILRGLATIGGHDLPGIGFLVRNEGEQSADFS